jgi:inosine-uridine nucleoside N-ribohydrolase
MKGNISLESRKKSINRRRTKFVGLLSKSIILRSMVVALIFVVAGSCSEKNVATSVNQKNQLRPVKVIFETDMGNDIDDALALDMLYKYADQNKVEILAVTINKDNEYASRYIDILNTWYGYPEIPIGKVINGADSEGDSKNYAQATWEHHIDGKPAFKGSISEYSTVPDAIKLYREILAQQPDSSVTIISVGFSTNIARLLSTPPDEFSDLSGKELISKKVKLLSVMAGNFDENSMKEYNVVKDINAAQKVFKEWPTKIAASPWEVGNEITYPASSIQNDFDWVPHHPLVVAYENYLPMPYDRPTWDLTSVLYAVEGNEGYFTMSERGKITVDENGYTSFTEDPEGHHQYLHVTPEQASKVRERFIDLVSAKPKNRE